MKVLKYAAPVLLAISLVGCAPSGGTAAVVNGETIPDSDIVRWSQGCAAATADYSGEDITVQQMRRQIVRWAVLGEIGQQYAEESGIEPSDEQVDEYAKQALAEEIVDHEVCGEIIAQAAKFDVIALSLGAQAGEMQYGNQVRLNPRYGVWDERTLNAEGSTSLSEAYAPR